MLVVTDSKNLTEAIKLKSLVEDPWLRTDMVAIQEAVENTTITEIIRVSTSDMANCLAKAGATGNELPERWPVNDVD